MSEGHSLFAPSAAERVIECPASLAINAKLPDRETIYSWHGTVLHQIADECWGMPENKFIIPNNPADYEGAVYTKTIDGVYREFVIEAKHVDAVITYLEFCRSIPGDHYSEQRLEHTKWTPSAAQLATRPDLPQEVRQRGTTDHAVLRPGVLEIVDFKGGEGVIVYAERNPQLSLYGLSAYDWYNEFYDFKKIIFHIEQPLIDHYDRWETIPKELLAHGSEIKKKFIEALSPDAPFGPSEKACKFCKASGRCRAQAESIHNAHAYKMDDLGGWENDPNTLTLENLGEFFQAKKLLAVRTAAVDEWLTRAMMRGEQLPGLKLAEGRTHRRWRSEHEALKAMAAAGIPEAAQVKPVIVTPAQAELLVHKPLRAALAEAIVKPPGKPTIVPANDPRPTFGARHAHVFDDLVDYEEGGLEGLE